jgi:hydrogenase expression/formation protein HypE
MTEKSIHYEGPVCAVPLPHQDQIVMGHGSGGRMTHDLIRKIFQKHFNDPVLMEGNDSGVFSLPKSACKLAFTTDSHIVSPLFFPGGDIGRLSICGTVNDLAVMGAEPLYLTAGFIIEEGFSTAVLEQVLQSMEDACREAGVAIASGDTKVVEKGKADGLFINTAGVGILPEGRTIGGQYARPGDAVLISGTIGDHGVAVLSAREDIGFETDVKSDTAPLNHMISQLLTAVPEVHVLRDPTRGGLGTTLKEIAGQSQVSIWLNEPDIPVQPAVQSACEMLGFDPLYVANEGKTIIILPEEFAGKALAVLHQNPYGLNAMRIGQVKSDSPGKVLLKTGFGSVRIVDMLSGEMLPRIC